MKLLKTSTLKTRLANLNSYVKEVTLSLAYYTTVHGDVSSLAKCDKAIANQLDRITRQYVCAKFNSKKGWTYNKKRSLEVLTELDLTYAKATFEEFVAAVENAEATKAAALEAAKEAEEALSPTEVEQKEKDKVLNYLVRSNLTELQLKSLVALVAQERAKKEQGSIKIAAAA